MFSFAREFGRAMVPVEICRSVAVPIKKFGRTVIQSVESRKKANTKKLPETLFKINARYKKLKVGAKSLWNFCIFWKNCEIRFWTP